MPLAEFFRDIRNFQGRAAVKTRHSRHFFSSDLSQPTMAVSFACLEKIQIYSFEGTCYSGSAMAFERVILDSHNEYSCSVVKA